LKKIFPKNNDCVRDGCNDEICQDKGKNQFTPFVFIIQDMSVINLPNAKDNLMVDVVLLLPKNLKNALKNILVQKWILIIR
jgi:hypothetical protein